MIVCRVSRIKQNGSGNVSMEDVSFLSIQLAQTAITSYLRFINSRPKPFVLCTWGRAVKTGA